MSHSQPKTIVVLPTYNELDNLPRMVEALFALEIDNFQILVVDDNSPDGTGQKADELSQQYEGRLSVLHRTEKNGLGPAYVAGFGQALEQGADYVVQMDCDFSHQPKYLLDMLKSIPNCDMVIGSRYVKDGGVDEGWSFLRKLLSWFANRVYTPLILGFDVKDATAGFRMWRREVLIGMNLQRVQSNGYVFQVEMAYIAHKLGYKICEIPIYFPDRQVGESKMVPTIATEAALRVWQLKARHQRLDPSQRARIETA